MNFSKDDDDRFLFAQMRLGKEDAFDFIFRKYYKILTVQATRFVHDQDTAQSLVQDCFVRFWEKQQQLPNVEDIYYYLLFMVRNRCIDHLREYKRTQQLFITKQTETTENEAESSIEADDLKFHLWLTIAKLPNRCRKAFEYSRIDGLSYAQIANEMGISQKAVEALISRALKLLRADLAHFLGILAMIFL
jgi:RNA polymerase sigma-70 factor (ECF subfamily)